MPGPRLLLVLLPLLCAAAPRPTKSAMRRAYERNQPSLVEVSAERRKSGPGVIVSADGHVVTSVDYVSIDRATLRIEGEDIPAEVVVADARLKVAVVRPQAGRYRSVAVNLGAKLSRGTWLLAVGRKKDGSFDPRQGQILRMPSARSPFVETDLFLPAGTPLFDGSGKLVAVLVTGKGKALPIDAVKAAIAQAAVAERPAP